VTTDAAGTSADHDSSSSNHTKPAANCRNNICYSVAVPDDDRPLIVLSWSWTRQDLGIDARRDVPPEAYQRADTVFETAAGHGVTPITVLRPEFVASGLTRATWTRPRFYQADFWTS
jgi:hypothetical protein